MSLIHLKNVCKLNKALIHDIIIYIVMTGFNHLVPPLPNFFTWPEINSIYIYIYLTGFNQ